MLLQLVYLKAVVVLLVIWRILTIGIFGQVVGGVLSATLAYCLSRRSNAVPQQVGITSCGSYEVKSALWWKSLHESTAVTAGP